MKNRKFKMMVIAVVITMVIAMLTGCSGGVSKEAMNKEADYYSYDDYNYDGSYYGYESNSTAAKAPGSAYNQNSSQLPTDQESAGRKLIRTIRMRVETLNFDESRRTITDYVSSLGGYIENSSISNNTYYSYYNDYRSNRSANYTVRIPSERLDSFLDAIGNVGNITYQTESTEDVTLSYLDVEARAKSLKIQQERLFALLEEASSIEDIISLNDRISEVTYQLESNESILRNYDNLVSYSTVNIDLDEVQRITEPIPETVGERIRSGLSDTFYNIAEGAKDFLVWFVVNLPLILIWLAIIAVCLYIIVSVVRLLKALRKKRIARKAARQAKREERKGPGYSAYTAPVPQTAQPAGSSGSDSEQNNSSDTQNK